MADMTANNTTANLLNNSSLADILDQNNSDTDDVNEPILLENSPYYNTSDFEMFLDSKSDIFTIVSLNCQSLNAKFDLLKYYIESYNGNSKRISAICLQETWLAADSDLTMLHLPGYRLISKGKSCSAHGGVSIFLHELIRFETMDLGYESDICDSQFLKIKLHTASNTVKVFILGNIYRPPRPTIENTNSFIQEMESVFYKLRNFKHVVLTGDFNFDLLKFKEDHLANCFLDCIMSGGYIPKIVLPTRLTQRKGTLIDNFFIKISDEYSAVALEYF